MDNTKAVQLTDDEVISLIAWHSRTIDASAGSEKIERMKYLDKRLKDFKPAPATAEWGKPND